MWLSSTVTVRLHVSGQSRGQTLARSTFIVYSPDPVGPGPFSRSRPRFRGSRSALSYQPPADAASHPLGLVDADLPWTSEVLAARGADHPAAVEDHLAAQEGDLHASGQLLTLERCVALTGWRFRRAHRETAVGVEKGKVGVVTDRDVPLAGQSEAARRIRAQELGHPVVSETATVALAEDAGQEILGAPEAGPGKPDVVGPVAGHLLLGR